MSDEIRAQVCSLLRKDNYCDQPFVSETTRCESDDFIQTIHDQDKMLCAFMCEG